MAQSLIAHERIITTQVKAKEVRRLVERLITYGKKNTIHARRIASRWVSDRTLLKKLFEDLAVHFKDREGGYTRILKYKERYGDGAPTVIFEFVGRRGEAPTRKKGKKGQGKSRQKAAEEKQAQSGKNSGPKSGAAPAEAEGESPQFGSAETTVSAEETDTKQTIKTGISQEAKESADENSATKDAEDASASDDDAVQQKKGE